MRFIPSPHPDPVLATLECTIDLLHRNSIFSGIALLYAKMILEMIICIVVVGVIAYIADEASQPKIGLPRIGANPGPFNILKWWARWNWVQDGHKDVIQAYAEVCHFTFEPPIWRSNPRC